MMSVRHAIQHYHDNGISEYLQKNGLTAGNLCFDILNPIDPSFFDESHNILELVLGQMYLHFKNRRKELKDHNQLDEMAVGKVRDCFDAVKRSLEV
jgi:hypothetical protein